MATDGKLSTFIPLFTLFSTSLLSIIHAIYYIPIPLSFRHLPLIHPISYFPIHLPPLFTLVPTSLINYSLFSHYLLPPYSSYLLPRYYSISFFILLPTSPINFAFTVESFQLLISSSAFEEIFSLYSSSIKSFIFNSPIPTSLLLYH